MASIEYNVAGQQIAVTKDAELVENTVGVYDVKFTFDSSWSSFTDKTAVFVSDTHPDAPYEVPLDANSEALIPAAVLKYGNLMIGVYGSTQTQQYPTVWAPPKRVWPGAGPGMEPPADPVFGMVVRTAPQELTSEQKSNARTNIGAASTADLATKMDKDTDGVVGNITVIDTNHNTVDSGIAKTTVVNTVADTATMKSNLAQITETVQSRNLYNGVNEVGYITSSGSTSSSASYHHTEMIDVSEYVGHTLYFGVDGESKYVRFLCAYDASGNVVQSAGSDSSIYNWTVPDGIKWAVFSFAWSVTGFSIEPDYLSAQRTPYYHYYQIDH